MKDMKNLPTKLADLVAQIKRYLPVLFGLFLVLLYGFLVYRVQVLNKVEPAASDVATQSTTAKVPRIDPSVLTQLQNLQDNSVSVQSLFDQARSNPFQE
jgi:hypothetical protein